MPAVAAVVLVVTAVVLVFLWRWSDRIEGLTGKDLATAQLDIVKTTSTIAVGGGGLFALYLATRRQRTQELELAHSERDATERRVTELYTKAADQLGADKAPVRLAGLYALERLAQGNEEHRQTVINLLCAYLRMPFAVPGDPPQPPPTSDKVDVLVQDQYDREVADHRERVQEREVRLTAQRILTDHLRPDLDKTTGKSTNPRYWPGHHRLDLTSATLIDIDLVSCHLGDALFGGATFTGDAEFSGATFTRRAEFSGATFTRRAEFGEATFTRRAEFVMAMFDGSASFLRATFTGSALFRGATFTGDAMFSGATFTRDALFEGATFTRAAAFFNGATFTWDAEFYRATFTKSAGFYKATFGGKAKFGKATFAGDAEFGGTTFTRDAEFDSATFARAPEFKGARFEQVVPAEVTKYTDTSEHAGKTEDGSP